MPAGDYIALVEGDPGLSFLGVQPAIGEFTLTTTAFPGVFPDAEACTDATEIVLPAAGAAVSREIAFADFSAFSEFTSACGGGGRERIFALNTTNAVTVTIDATVSEGLDTVIYLLEGATCVAAVEVEDACNDDSDAPTAGRESRLEVELAANSSYFLVVDTFGSLEPTAASTVTITAQ